MTVEATTAHARQFTENTLVAKDKERVVGFAVVGSSRDEDLPDAGEIEAISRLKEYNTIFLWVLEKNERAIDFYRKYGFSEQKS